MYYWIPYSCVIVCIVILYIEYQKVRNFVLMKLTPLNLDSIAMCQVSTWISYRTHNCGPSQRLKAAHIFTEEISLDWMDICSTVSMQWGVPLAQTGTDGAAANVWINAIVISLAINCYEKAKQDAPNSLMCHQWLQVINCNSYIDWVACMQNVHLAILTICIIKWAAIFWKQIDVLIYRWVSESVVPYA